MLSENYKWPMGALHLNYTSFLVKIVFIKVIKRFNNGVTRDWKCSIKNESWVEREGSGDSNFWEFGGLEYFTLSK
jgi:hypothetical protein